MRAELRVRLGEALGVSVQGVRRLSGGDICAAWAVTLLDGDTIFVKTHPHPSPSMFPQEAAGLSWLSARGPLRTPAVLAVSSAFLALRFVAPGGCGVDAERLGHGLAALHRFPEPSFGGDAPNFLGTLPQENAPSSDWAAFYRDRRLGPLIARARPPLRLHRRLDRLLATLADRVGPPEPPAPLHGDLWSGNLLVGVDGQPWLIDPAAYAGHREVDLSMMRLFGGFSGRVFDAYQESYPLSPGWRERIPLWQLYYLLAHVCLHGPHWWDGVDQALSALRIP